VPALHAPEQLLAPAAAENLPASQSEHALDSVLAAYLPAVQAKHAADELAPGVVE